MCHFSIFFHKGFFVGDFQEVTGNTVFLHSIFAKKNTGYAVGVCIAAAEPDDQLQGVT